jgi:excisionase family DNA binding protein
MTSAREGGRGPWLTTPAAAGYLGMTEKALREAVRRGRIPCYRLGRLLRFNAAELDGALTPCPCSTIDAEGCDSGG